MIKKYGIGFLAATILSVGVLTFAYQSSYNQTKAELVEEEKKQAESEPKKEVVRTEGQATKEDVYYLTELNGYVAVYLSDRTTVYEFTNIAVDALPDEIKAEIKEGKVIEGTKSLYGFLESYSS